MARYERLLQNADEALRVKSDVHTSRAILEEAMAEYRRVGSPNLDPAINRLYIELIKDQAKAWLTDIETQLTSIGGEKTAADVREFVDVYRKQARRFLSPADQASIEARIIAINDKAAKARRESLESKPEDFKEVEELNRIASDLSRDLATARSSNPTWDPREPRTPDMPILKLGRAIKAVERLTASENTSPQEAKLRENILATSLNPARSLAEELRDWVQALDAPFITGLIARLDAYPPSIEVQNKVSENVAAITNIADLDTGISDLEATRTAVERALSSLTPRYPVAQFNELQSLFPGQKFASVEEAYTDYWNNKKNTIDAEIERRNRRKQEIADQPMSLAEGLAKINQVISQIEELARLPVLVQIQDVVGPNIQPAYDALKQINVSESDKEILRQEVLLFDYRQTKRIIDFSLTTSEVNSSENQQWFTSALYDSRVKGEFGFGRLEKVQKEIERQVTSGIATPNLASEIARDRNRFENEINFRRLVFVAEQSVESNIWQSKGETDPVRKYPTQNPSIFIKQEDIPKVVLPSEALANDAKLRFPGEAQYNYELPAQNRNIVRQPNFNHIEVTESFTPTLHGEIMRMLDWLYSDRMAGKYREALNPALLAGTVSLDDPISTSPDAPSHRKFLSLLKGYFKIMHQETRKDEIQVVIQQCAKVISGLDVSQAQVRHAWYMHTLFCNQSMLIPGKSPFTNDAIYKGNQALTYLTSGILGGTTPASIWEVGYYFGVDFQGLAKVKVNHGGHETEVEIPPTYNLLDDVGRVDTKIGHLPKAETWPEKIGYGISGVRTHEDATSARDKIREALSETPELSEFLYLADPPLVKIPPSEFGTLPIIPTVLQFMQFENESYFPPKIDPATGKPYVDPVTHQPLTHDPITGAPYDAKTQKVIRWASNPGKIPPPVNATDYLDSDGNILYELVPWNKVTNATDINSWYNNGTNINKLYNIFMGPPSGDLLDRNNLPKEQNETKYAAAFFPVLGPEVAADNFNAEKVFRRITVVHVFSRCITLLAQDKIQLHELIHKLHGLNEVIGHNAVNAIDKSLTKAFGQAEDLQRLRENYLKEMQEFLKFR